MILLIIGLFAVAAICLGAQHWLYKKIKVKCMIGQIFYNCPNPFIIYDFSKFDNKGIVGVMVGTQDSETTITDEVIKKVQEVYPDYDGNLLDVMPDVDLFYVKNAVIPYNRLRKRHEKWRGELCVWDS